MSSPGPLFRPYQRLIKIKLKGKELEIPENNMLLRGLQFLAPENVSYGRFCWNEECQYCRVTYDSGEGTKQHVALSCKLMVKEGMRVTEVASEISYCLRDVIARETWLLAGENFLQSRFFEKALPDGDLRYFSNANACFSSENARYVLRAQGANLEVCGTTPALCFFRRERRSPVMPT